MIWGEVINSIRQLHLDLVQEFSLDPALYTRDIEITPIPIPFPEYLDDFEEWDELSVPSELQDLLPLHPVERALIEGPLLPIQIIKFKNPREIELLFAAVLGLEKSWLDQNKKLSPDKIKFMESFFSVQTLKLSVRAGFQKLATTKDVKS